MKKVLICIILILSVLFCGCSTVKLENEETADTVFSVELSSVETEIVTETAEKTEAEPVVNTASFVGVGDNIIYYGNVRDAKSKAVSGGREYNFKTAYSEVEGIISSADIAFINQETLMCGDSYELSYYPLFNSPQDLGYDLCEIGFDIINIANNHMLDKGGAGLSATIDFWKNLPVTLIGGYPTDDDFYNVPIVEKNGIRIAYISYCEMTNGNRLAAEYGIRIPYLNEEDIRRQCASVKDKCDFIIASVHWGDEGSFTPDDEQRMWAQIFADCGVDVILGHHPHVIQPVEWIYSDDTRTLCVYSLGNFMAEQNRDYHMLGGMISFDIQKIDDNPATVENPVFTPTVLHFPSNFYDNKIYLFKDFTDELAKTHGVKTYYGNKISVESIRSYIESTVSEEFLPDYLK